MLLWHQGTHIYTVVGLLVSRAFIFIINAIFCLPGNKERYAGPVLMGAGILVMGRGAFWKLKQLDCRATLNRHRALWRRLCSWVSIMPRRVPPCWFLVCLLAI